MVSPFAAFPEGGVVKADKLLSKPMLISGLRRHDRDRDFICVLQLACCSLKANRPSPPDVLMVCGDDLFVL